MMMPANFSAISENEMTYVSGGASLSEILAPALTVENWQKFNTNMVTLVGNKFLGEYVNRTVGALFSGTYTPGKLTTLWANSIAGAYDTGKAALGEDSFFAGGSAIPGVANGVLNAGLQLLGNAAAIYNLATANTEVKFVGISKKDAQ